MFRKLLGWVSGLIPREYSVSVAIKKIAYMVGKLGVGFIISKYAFGGNVTPDQVIQIQAGVTTATAASLEALHDYLKLRFPDIKWL